MELKRKKLQKLKDNKTPCIFTWLDVTSEHRKDIAKLDRVTPTSLLETCYLHGHLYNYDKYAIIIATETMKSGNEIDYTVIPFNNIIDIKELKGGG